MRIRAQLAFSHLVHHGKQKKIPLIVRESAAAILSRDGPPKLCDLAQKAPVVSIPLFCLMA